MSNILSKAVKKIRRDITARRSRAMSTAEMEKALEDWYAMATRKMLGQAQRLDLKTPRTFNEKLQWLKIHEQSELRTQLSDKYLAKKLVGDIIGQEYIVPLYGVWDRYADIDFDRLPDSFALKVNHGNGWQLLVEDKKLIDHRDAKEKFDKWLLENYAYKGFELQYRDIEPKIFAEKLMTDEENPVIYDYRISCFNGRPEFLLVTVVDADLRLTTAFFDLDYKHMPSFQGLPEMTELPPRPVSLELMLDLSRKLSQKFCFARVDFYEISGRPYFGEITFHPNLGITPWIKEGDDLKYGQMLRLPIEK